jgi:DNA-binding XRE family transcriptional regulator
MLGTDLPAWRKRNRFTQDTLREALGVKSRQTIITWEKSGIPCLARQSWRCSLWTTCRKCDAPSTAAGTQPPSCRQCAGMFGPSGNTPAGKNLCLWRNPTFKRRDKASAGDACRHGNVVVRLSLHMGCIIRRHRG